MAQKTKKFILIVSLIFGLFGSILLTDNQTLALTISPPLREFTADPGTEFSDVIKLINEDDVEKTFYATIEGFRARGEKGEPEFFQTADETQLATWITLEETAVTLKPREKREIEYTISVPEKASAGGHYAAIFWSSTPPQMKEKTGVGVVTKVGSLILVRVSGEIKEEMRLIDFSTSQKFYNRLPVQFFVAFENSGNVHLKPMGEIEIEPKILGIGGGKISVNEGGGNVLPKSIRRFDASWQKTALPPSRATNVVSRFFEELKNEWKNFALGSFEANLFVLFGATPPQTVERTLTFYVFPWRVILVGLIAAILLILILARLIRAYNRWIIKKAKLKMQNAKG